MRLLIFFLLLTTGLHASAQSPLGTWKTIDDETGEAKSHVLIYEQDGLLYGKVTKLLVGDANALCEECTGTRHLQPILDMVILWKMEQDDDEWEDGNILDPENGNTYSCKLWLDEDDSDILKVRGYLGIFYRTQTWQRVK